MRWFHVEVAGLRMVQHVATGLRHMVGTCGHCALPTLLATAGCVLLSCVLLRHFSRDYDWVPVHVAAWAGGAGITRKGRRCDGRPVGGEPLDPSVLCASYARFSSDMQRDESISDQQRKCHEKAAANGHAISRQLEFSDQAVSGTKRHRDGLDAMLAAAEAGKLQVLYFHSLSRLSRESVITLPLLKQLVYNYGVRVISVTEGIDSDDTAWELIAHIMSIVHEQYLKDLAENVLRGQEGAVLAGLSVGDYCFGYTSAPVPGTEQGRRGRNTKPRKMYIIDAATAPWVARIFRWFVHERQSVRWIARELNRLGAPKDHRATTKEWRHQYLPKLLRNRKYIGCWPWGEKKNVRDPLTGKVRQKDRSPEECEKWLRHLPHLQLIDNEIFQEAQRLLDINDEVSAVNRKEKGKFNGSKPGASGRHPCHLLSQLIVCGHCGRTFYVGGTGGKYLFCPGYHMGLCGCQTQLRRDRGQGMILKEIGQRILANPAWRQRVLEETVKAWNAQEAAIPTELAAARRSLAEVEQKIANILDRMEGGRGGPELDDRLAQRRLEKRDLTEQVERLQRADQGRPPAPTETWVDERLNDLGDVLAQGTPAAAHALRNLVGGKIVVTEIRQPGRERHYLQGRFTVTTKAVVEMLVGPTDERWAGPEHASGDHSEEIVIDFREPPEIESLSERAKQLYDQGVMNAQIAKELGCARNYVTKLLKFWFESRGLKMPDGRSRRSTLQQKHLEPPVYQQIADEAMALYQQGMLLQDVANTLQVDRNTITAVIRWWHETRGLPVPDGRTRRKDLDVKTSRTIAKSPAEGQSEKAGPEPEAGEAA